MGEARSIGQVLGLINRERKKRMRVNENIRIEEWEGYFRGLLTRDGHEL